MSAFDPKQTLTSYPYSSLVILKTKRLERRAFLLAAGASILALGGCSSSREASYRLRMTVEVQTASGLKRGSSVLEIFASKFGFRTSESGVGKGRLLGEAVTVDLPGRPLFVLLKLPASKGELGGYVTQALAGANRFGSFDDFFAAVQKLGGWFGGSEAELPREYWPIMVQFADAHDSKTVAAVDPDSIGVKRILLQTTKSNRTSDIRRRLSWLGSSPEPSLNPEHGPYDWSLPATLTQGDFISS